LINNLKGECLKVGMLKQMKIKVLMLMTILIFSVIPYVQAAAYYQGNSNIPYVGGFGPVEVYVDLTSVYIKENGTNRSGKPYCITAYNIIRVVNERTEVFTHNVCIIRDGYNTAYYFIGDDGSYNKMPLENVQLSDEYYNAAQIVNKHMESTGMW